ncbi:NADP-dependent oxidoreductase [Duganella radicis]|uniref:Zinc-binding dehydrogenase n=1 Tax=Duganella radicis TaxID=551988 RepID=A0A6L6PJZ4_9BURK|nr:NADP-dependent oxidoreductase [Duganella radicis]MTV39293.1 zinc-binding dehydrogenase [Duganella radicis]
MKALTLQRYGSIDHLSLAEIARPAIKPDEILVKVHAAGINPIDYMIPKGMFKPIMKLTLPATMGSDFAGVVVEIGNRVRRFKVGDAVYGSVFDLDGGSFAEFVAAPERAVALKPLNLSFVQAAAVPMVGLTAWQAFKEIIQLKAGQKVFIPAGAGGIGTFAIQLAKQLGASVGTTTSTGNVALVRGLGADEVVDYKTQEFDQVLKDYDAVLATMRGDGLSKALRIVRPGGKAVSLVGPPDSKFAERRGMNVVMRLVFTLLSSKIRRLAKRRAATYDFMFVRADGAQLGQIGELLEAGRIRPVIDRVYPLAQAHEALRYLEQGRAKGKVVLQMVA